MVKLSCSSKVEGDRSNQDRSEKAVREKDRENGVESKRLGTFCSHFLHQFVRNFKVGMDLGHVFVLL